MACLINSGLSDSCRTSMGGVARYLIGNADEVDSITVVTTPGVTLNAITEIKMLETTTPGVYHTMYEIDTAQYSASLTSELVIALPQKHYKQGGGFAYSTMNQDVINFFEKLNLAKLFIVIQTAIPNGSSEGRVFVAGLSQIGSTGLYATTSTGNIGANPSDLSGRQVTFEGFSLSDLREVIADGVTHLTLRAFLDDLLDPAND